ncbi:MAG: ROK family protein [Dictyoglomus sp.]|jgi:glucokinase|uniref:ROK family protein n=1 Tax=Dictyoglomus sp. TaxID=28205 RepID=UPI000CCF29C3|nr:MAG: ROK family protein [Dictyoglomus turgidum]
MRKAVGVDLGGTKINVLLVNEKGEVLVRDKQPTEADRGKDYVINKIKDMIHNVLQQGRVSEKDIEGIGIGFPGLMDREKKSTLYAPNLGDEWKKEVFLGRELEEYFNIPTYLENDVNLIAWAEWLVGAGRGTKTMICVALGTGIGSGIVLNGKLWIGAHGMAGEFGHITVLPDGPICGCGNRGCIEAIASGTGIEKYARSILPQHTDSLIWGLCNGNLEEVTVKTIYQAAEQGDKLAIDIFNHAGYYLGIALANYVHIVDPEKIVIGGGVANVREYIGKPMREEFYRRVLPSFRDKVTFSWAELGEDAGGIGAALLALYR